MNPDTKSKTILLASNNNLMRALETLEQAPAEERDWEWLFLKGWLFYQSQDCETAASFLQQSLVQKANNPDALFFLGLALGAKSTKHRGWALVRDYAKRALQIICDNPDLQNWTLLKKCLETLGDAATNVGPASDAELAYRSLIDIYPENATYYEKLAEIIGESSPHETAEILEKAALLNPQSETTRQNLSLLRESLNTSLKEGEGRGARYPSMEEMQGDAKSVISRLMLGDVPKTSFITPKTSFFTMGSCFAREIAHKLQERGHRTLYLEMAEHINSTFANRCTVEWALGQCTGQPKERLESMFGPAGITPEWLMQAWKNSDVIIYTLGVAPAFFDKTSGDFVMPRGNALSARALADIFEFRTAPVPDHLANLNFIFERIRTINPTCHFVITVSPVPLRMTFEFESAINADCLSKSTLRVVAHEFMQQQHKNTYYWPSFESVRWLGSHVGPYYGVDDGSSLHISETHISAITELFIDYFSHTDSAGNNTPQ